MSEENPWNKNDEVKLGREVSTATPMASAAERRAVLEERRRERLEARKGSGGSGGAPRYAPGSSFMRG
jgi:hypothetical protein